MSKSFQELGVSAPVIRALAGTGITHPFAIQGLVLPDALAGLDILAESPTGSGKTLAFGLPLIERTAGSGKRPGALVLVPTRELALQVAADLTPLAAAKGVSVATVYGGAPIAAQIRKARSAHVLVATPGRLYDLLERRAVSLSDVRVLVLDEADRMLDMGFKPQVDRILRSVPANRQTMLFSATLDGGVAELARAYTVTPSHVRAELPAEAQRGEVEHTFVAVTSEDKLERLVEQLGADRGLALVFVRTKHGADKLARKLERQHRIKAVAMHGNLSQSQRERALAQFDVGPRLDARRDRRRRARPRRRRHHARDQLRSAARRQRLRPPRRPHGPSGAQRHRHHARAARAAPRRRPPRRAPRPRRPVRRLRHVGCDEADAEAVRLEPPPATADVEPPGASADYSFKASRSARMGTSPLVSTPRRGQMSDDKSDRAGDALKRDWEQTKHDLPGLEGKDLDQDAGDTIGQATGKEPVPGENERDRD